MVAAAEGADVPRAADLRLFAQAAPEPMAFEVASIKPAAMASHDGEGSSRSMIECSADGILMHNIDLGEMIEWSYSLDHSQVQGLPSHGERYDVRARTNNAVSVSMLRKMVQELLSSRFSLRAHQEEKLTPVYDLVIARGGVRLTASKGDALPQGSLKENLPRVVDGSFVFRNVSLAEFARQLSELRGIEFPVIDRTGIQGTYDITLQSAAREVLESDGSTLPALIREQLGLKLVSAKEPFRVLVVDHVEKPSPD
jgi:uncharacterized protein (TIGR03435 family)